MKSSRPEIWNILLAGVDGSLASHAGESTARRRYSGLVPDADFQRLRSLVAQCDAVVIGARTVAAERGAFRVASLRESGGEPLWIVFSASGNIDSNHPFWHQEGFSRTICHCTEFSMSSRDGLHSQIRELSGSNVEFMVGSLVSMLKSFRERGISRIALLGGGELNALFWGAGVVDRLFLTVTPWMMGGAVHLLGQKLPARVPLSLEECRREGDLLFLEYATKVFVSPKLVPNSSESPQETQ